MVHCRSLYPWVDRLQRRLTSSILWLIIIVSACHGWASNKIFFHKYPAAPVLVQAGDVGACCMLSLLVQCIHILGKWIECCIPSYLIRSLYIAFFNNPPGFGNIILSSAPQLLKSYHPCLSGVPYHPSNAGYISHCPGYVSQKRNSKYN